MGLIYQNDFSEGWTPSADQTGAQATGLVRMDNCVLDELGAVALRLGSSKINSSALANADLRSIYSTLISGTRHRLVQGAGSIYAASGTGDFAEIDTGFDDTLDAQFGGYLGNVFYGSGSVRRRYDGSSAYQWGLSTPSAVPTVDQLSPNNSVFASCDSSETTWTTEEGSASAVAGFDGTANGARALQSSASTFRGVSSRDIGASTDFTTYAGNDAASDDDLVEMYVKIDEPDKVDYITVTIDCNGSSAASYDRDFFSYTWNSAKFLAQKITPFKGMREQIEASLAQEYTAEGSGRESVLTRTFTRPGFGIIIRPEPNGWHYLSARRGDFIHTRTNDDKSWNTVRGVRVAFGGRGRGTVAFDRIRMIGGATRPLSGRYKLQYVYVREGAYYNAKSAPSGLSAEIEVKNQGIQATCTNPTDTQVTHIWLFAMGGVLDKFYRVARQAVASYSGTVPINYTMSDRDAMILNIPLEQDAGRPPSNIIGISEDYFTRLFCLTSDGLIYPSMRLNPETFRSGQAIRVAGTTETPHWIKKTFGGIYVGTSKDIYRIHGTGAEYPDGTVDLESVPLQVNSPPINSCIAWDGNLLIYFAEDGPRLFNGEASSPLRGQTDLLWRGYTRHGISPPNTASGRFRAAIAKGILAITVPEGTATTSSNVLYRYNFSQQRWYRHTYENGVGSTKGFRSLFREQDGSLVAGDDNGFVWLLDDSAATGDQSSGMAVTIWTKHHTLPTGRGQPTTLRTRLDTGDTPMTVTLHLDGKAFPWLTGSPRAVQQEAEEFTLSGLPKFRQASLRFSGTTTTFRLHEYGIHFNALPDGRKYWEIPPPAFRASYFWLRETNIRGQGSASLTLTPVIDGVGFAPITIQADAEDGGLFRCCWPRNCHGRQLGPLRISASEEVAIFSVQFVIRQTGGELDRQVVEIAATQ